MKNKFKILADFHFHTVASGHAYSTVLEYAEYAKKAGLKYIAMTDHGPNMPGGPHIYHFENIQMVPSELFGVRILRGAEVNIIDDEGSLDIPDHILAELEFALFTFHPRCGYVNSTVQKNTEVMVKAMDNPYLFAIAHLENQQFLVDYDEVVLEAKKRNLLIELNNSSYLSRPGSRESALKVLKAVKKNNAKISLGTDSHMCTMIGKFDYAFELLNEVGISPDLVINTSEKMIKEYVLEKKRQC